MKIIILTHNITELPDLENDEGEVEATNKGGNE